MDLLITYLRRLYLEAPWCYLSWPALAMVVGTTAAAASPRLAARLGVVPRKASGLPGILSAPFVHANAAHLAANLPPFVVLGGLVVRRDAGHFVGVAVSIALIQGALVWLFGRNASHVGMSGVIFGFLGYLITAGWLTRTTNDLIVAGGVMLVYGGLLAGVKPVRGAISWEGHLFGLLAGIARAWMDLG